MALRTYFLNRELAQGRVNKVRLNKWPLRIHSVAVLGVYCPGTAKRLISNKQNTFVFLISNSKHIFYHITGPPNGTIQLDMTFSFICRQGLCRKCTYKCWKHSPNVGKPRFPPCCEFSQYLFIHFRKMRVTVISIWMVPLGGPIR